MQAARCHERGGVDGALHGGQQLLLQPGASDAGKTGHPIASQAVKPANDNIHPALGQQCCLWGAEPHRCDLTSLCKRVSASLVTSAFFSVKREIVRSYALCTILRTSTSIILAVSLLKGLLKLPSSLG